MSDSIVLEGREYVSAKRASELSGYARDYIGQLARKGLISAQRVGGLWYVSMDSLQGYQKNAETYQPAPPPQQQGTDVESVVSFDGKDYVSASRGSKLTGYNQDYIGQLARAGKLLSRQIGNRWYVEREGLLAHKSQKDSLLANVQREAVGLTIPEPARPVETTDQHTAYYKYISEAEKDLLPKLADAGPRPADMAREVSQSAFTTHRSEVEAIPIRVGNTIAKKRYQGPIQDVRARAAPRSAFHRRGRTSRKTMIRAAQAVVALTFVIVLSYGLVTLKSSSVYTFNSSGLKNAISRAAAAAAASAPVDSLTSFLERLLTRELSYQRAD